MKLIVHLIRNRIIRWLLVLLCMLGIFAMSHLDSVKSWYMTGKILTTVTQTQDVVEDMDYKEEIGYYSAEEQDFAMHLIRKLAHVIEFFALFLLLVNALWQEHKPLSLSANKSTLIIASTVTLLYAIFDEVHQLFVPGRTGSVSDVLIDAIGILLGLLVLRRLESDERISVV